MRIRRMPSELIFNLDTCGILPKINSRVALTVGIRIVAIGSECGDHGPDSYIRIPLHLLAGGPGRCQPDIRSRLHQGDAFPAADALPDKT